MDETIYGYWLPPDGAAHGPQIDQLLFFMHVFMAVIFVGWAAFLIVCLYKFRARPGHAATYALPKAPLVKYAEIFVVFVELLLLFGISTPIWWRYKEAQPDEASALKIKVIAEQYSWNFHYAGRDNTFGKTTVEAMSGDNPVGLDPDDAAGKDDIVTINQMHVPLGRPVIVELSSKDVIHGFNIPVLRLKQDVIPGQLSRIWFTATRPGHYELACAQLCGLAHYRMRGDVFVDTPEEFAKWFAENSPAAEQKGSDK